MGSLLTVLPFCLCYTNSGTVLKLVHALDTGVHPPCLVVFNGQENIKLYSFCQTIAITLNKTREINILTESFSCKYKLELS